MDTLSQPDVPRYKLYTPVQVGVGAFFGSALTACWLIAHNYRAQGQTRTANQWVLGGVIGVICLLTIGFFLPKNVLGTGFHIGMIGALYNVEKMQRAARLAAHPGAVEDRVSWWAVFGWSLLACVIILSVVGVISFFLPDSFFPADDFAEETTP